MLNTTVFYDDFAEVDFRVKAASFLMFQVGKSSDLMLFFFILRNSWTSYAGSWEFSRFRTQRCKSYAGEKARRVRACSHWALSDSDSVSDVSLTIDILPIFCISNAIAKSSVWTGPHILSVKPRAHINKVKKWNTKDLRKELLMSFKNLILLCVSSHRIAILSSGLTQTMSG